MTAGIYRIRNRDTGVAYVGSAVDLVRRVRAHVTQLDRGRHGNTALQTAWSLHGRRAFMFGLLEVVAPEVDALNEAEQRWLDRYAGRLYNVRARATRGHPDTVTLLRRGIGAPEDVASARATHRAYIADFVRRSRARWRRGWQRRRGPGE